MRTFHLTTCNIDELINFLETKDDDNNECELITYGYSDPKIFQKFITVLQKFTEIKSEKLVYLRPKLARKGIGKSWYGLAEVQNQIGTQDPVFKIDFLLEIVYTLNKLPSANMPLRIVISTDYIEDAFLKEIGLTVAEGDFKQRIINPLDNDLEYYKATDFTSIIVLSSQKLHEILRGKFSESLAKIERQQLIRERDIEFIDILDNCFTDVNKESQKKAFIEFAQLDMPALHAEYKVRLNQYQTLEDMDEIKKEYFGYIESEIEKYQNHLKSKIDDSKVEIIEQPPQISAPTDQNQFDIEDIKQKFITNLQKYQNEECKTRDSSGKVTEKIRSNASVFLNKVKAEVYLTKDRLSGQKGYDRADEFIKEIEDKTSLLDIIYLLRDPKYVDSKVMKTVLINTALEVLGYQPNNLSFEDYCTYTKTLLKGDQAQIEALINFVSKSQQQSNQLTL